MRLVNCYLSDLWTAKRICIDFRAFDASDEKLTVSSSAQLFAEIFPSTETDLDPGKVAKRR
jgi:hypothetical protein